MGQRNGQFAGKKQGECHMCGLVGIMSKEHYFPKWMWKYHPIENTTSINLATGIEKSREVATFTINQICKDCNGGWMSSLQSAAKPLIAPLLVNDEPIMLTAADAYVIAQWFVMTTMVYEKDNPQGGMGVALAERQAFVANQSIGSSWQVWLGRSAGPMTRGISHRPIIQFERSTQKRILLGQSTVMVAGKLILLSFSGRYPFVDNHLQSWRMQRAFPDLNKRFISSKYKFPELFHPRILNEVVRGFHTSPVSAWGRWLGDIPVHQNIVDGM